MKVVFLDRGTFSTELALPMPQGISDYTVYDHTPQNIDTIIQRCQHADIIITNKVQLTQGIIAQLPNLKLIQLTATGIDNIDKNACKQHNIKLFNVAGYASKSVPEHTFMLILSAMRAGKHYHQTAIDGTWQQSQKFCLLDLPLIDLENKTLGIIGAGTIGKKVAQIAQAFGMQILWAEHQGKSPRNDNYQSFEYVLANSDIISLHCPLTDDTHHLINHNTIKQMHQKPLIANLARGAIVDSQAIINAIEQQQIFGYVSDVFEQEPFAPNDPLLTIADHPRVIFSPHNAWASLSAQQTLWQILCKQISEFIQYHQISNKT